MAIIPARFRFLTPPEYFGELAAKVGQAPAGGRVVAVTMTFAPWRPEVRRLLHALGEAARRGAQVTLVMDAKQFLLPGGEHSVGVVPGPLFFNGELPLKLRGQPRILLEALEQLQDAGGRYVIVNQPGKRFTNPVAGRSHIKFTVIGDEVYVGSCNLDTDGHIDMMTVFEDGRTADWLCELSEKIATAGSVRRALDDQDITRSVNATDSLLVDAGVRGQSLILAKTLELIDAAREWIAISSQFFPNDVTGDHLLAAHKRGVRVEVFYNYPGQFGWPHNLLHFGVVAKAKRSLPASFFEHAERRGFIHAKLVVTEQAAMLGSHNHVRIGVNLGTAEMALVSYDLEFGRQALATLARQTSGNPGSGR